MGNEVHANDVFNEFVHKLKLLDGNLRATCFIDEADLTIVNFFGDEDVPAQVLEPREEMKYALIRQWHRNGLHKVSLMKCVDNTTIKRVWSCEFDHMDDDPERVTMLRITFNSFIDFMEAFNS